MRYRHFLMIAALIYITPGLVYMLTNLPSPSFWIDTFSHFDWYQAQNLLIYLGIFVIFILFSPGVILLVPYGTIFTILYYAVGYGLLYRYWKKRGTGVERLDSSEQIRHMH